MTHWTPQRQVVASNRLSGPDTRSAPAVAAIGNPSTLEQRTGRVDWIGGKMELCHQPIRVYLPYLAGTQDEKQYRVVMDRERWFGVVMGEKYKVDARTTEKLARRIPLPESVAKELAFRLGTSS